MKFTEKNMEESHKRIKDWKVRRMKDWKVRRQGVRHEFWWRRKARRKGDDRRLGMNKRFVFRKKMILKKKKIKVSPYKFFNFSKTQSRGVPLDISGVPPNLSLRPDTLRLTRRPTPNHPQERDKPIRLATGPWL